jgi:hypothetical protein
MKHDLSHKVIAAHAALKEPDVTTAEKHLSELSDQGVDVSEAGISLQTYSDLVTADPNDTTTHAAAWSDFRDVLLNTDASAVETDESEAGEPEGIASPENGKPEAPAASAASAPESAAPVAAAPTVNYTPVMDPPGAPPTGWLTYNLAKKIKASKEQLAADREAKIALYPSLAHLKFPDDQPSIPNVAPMGGFGIAYAIQPGFDPAVFDTDRMGPPPIPQGLGFLPIPHEGGFTDDYPQPQCKSLEGYEYFVKLADQEFGLVLVHSANQGRIHGVELNTEKPGWASFYAGTSKRNATLNSMLKYALMVPKDSAPAIPDLAAIAAAAAAEAEGKKAGKVPKGAGPAEAPVPDGPVPIWNWDLETYTGKATREGDPNTFNAEISQVGAHIFAIWSIEGDGPKPADPEGKIRLKATTREKGREEIEKRFHRGEFNG